MTHSHGVLLPTFGAMRYRTWFGGPPSQAVRTALPIAALFALVLTSCSERRTPATPPRPVRVTALRYEDELTTARYSGEVKARYETPLSFQVGGKIASRLADVGATVNPGNLLATLDAADYALNQASAGAQLAAAKAELEQARKDLMHLGNLREQQLASEASYDRRRDIVQAAEARVKDAQAALALTRRRSIYTELRAEQAGVITGVEAEVGQVVTAGQAIFHLARTEEKEVVIQVPENRLDDLRSATTLQVSLWAAPDVLFPAKVREISPGVDTLIRTYTVKVTLLERDPRIRMGMTATVQVQRAEPRPVASVPLTALYRGGGQPAVWVVDAETQTVNLHPVTVQRYDADSVKIVEGPASGQWIVTAGVHKLLPAQKIRLLEPESTP